MKQLWKRGAALLVILLLVLGLCGCDALDAMRAAQTQYGEDGSILYKGVAYMRLPESDYLAPEYDVWEAQDIYVTDPEVPVLLSQAIYIERLAVSLDGNFLISISDQAVYCRAELYESVCDQILNGFEVAAMRYSYDAYDEERGVYQLAYYTLTREQMAAVYQVLETVEPTVMGSDWYIDSQWWMVLEECSQDRFFRLERLELAASENSYTLMLEDGEQTLAYLIPTEYKAVFAQIISTYVRASEELYSPDW